MIRKIIKKIYNRSIDDNISSTILLYFCINKILCLFRGIIRFRKRVFLEKGAIIKCRRKIKFGRNFRCERNVTIDALSSHGIKFGDNCSIGKNTRIECTGSFSILGKGFKCGDNCGLGTDSFYGCAGGIEIGNDVIVGNYVSMHSENHNFDALSCPIRLQGVNHKGIKIGNDCWIGAKVTILDGAEIGDGCVIAAGAVVRGKFPNNVVIAGVPAKIVKRRM